MRFSLRRELALGLAVYALYLLVRRLVLAADGRARARRNAETLVDVEERLGLAVEPGIQRVLLRDPRVVHGLNVGYAVANVGLSVGWLVALYRRRDPGYHRSLRRSCLLAHVAAQPVFLRFPTAPPRVLGGIRRHRSEVSGLDLEHRVLVRLYNPVAAMPSLHLAFAVLTGAELAARARSRPVKAAGRAAAYPTSRRARRLRHRQPLRARRGRRCRSGRSGTAFRMSEELSGGRWWRPAGWQLVAGLAAAVLLALGVGLLIARAAGFSEVRDAIERADSKWFGICRSRRSPHSWPTPR